MIKNKTFGWLIFDVFSLLLFLYLFFTINEKYVFLIMGYSFLITAKITDICKLICTLNTKWGYPFLFNELKDASIVLSMILVSLHLFYLVQ